MSTIRLTTAQAIVRFLAAQKTEIDGATLPLFGGVWAIFGHGNVAGMGEALHGMRDILPTFRGHNEQGMAHAAIAFAKASRRRRMMACTTSIGPGATNMVTAAAVAHVNRLPVLLLPGDVFANRRPDPVLQQIENFSDGTISANDCFRPVSRYFDRIARPEQIIPALQRAMNVLTDPAECGPVTLALCQDTQAEAYDYPESFFAEKIWTQRRIRPDESELAQALAMLKSARKPFIVAGGGVLFSGADKVLADFAARHGIPAGETQAGKSSLPHDHAANLGALGVTGTAAANALAEEADVVLAVGTRLQDFTTGSWALFKNPDRRIIGLNVQTFDATKHNALPLVADAKAGLEELGSRIAGLEGAGCVDRQCARCENALVCRSRRATPIRPMRNCRPTRRSSARCSASPQHRTWSCARQAGFRASCTSIGKRPALGYHMEYGYSCMGYEIAGGLGVKMADPKREVIVMVGDGSYLMMNSELATSVMLGLKLTVVLLDNRGYGCINRLQRATGCGELQQPAPAHPTRRRCPTSISPPTRQVSEPRPQGRQHQRARDGVESRARCDCAPRSS